MRNRIVCKLCKNAIRHPDNHHRCNICFKFFHRNCVPASNHPYFCYSCLSDALPFHHMTNKSLYELFCPSVDEFIRQFKRNLNESSALNEALENDDTCPCTYHDIDSFNNLIPSLESNDLLILSCNIASLCQNQHKIEQFLSVTSALPSIIAISETKIRISDNITDQYNLENYNYTFEHNDTPTYFGGVGFYIQNNINYILRNDISLDIPSCEDLWIEIKDQSNKSSICGVIYRHRKHNIQTFQNEMMRIINKLNLENKPIYICGDINIDIGRYHISQPTKHYVDTLQSLSYRILIDKPTRITTNTATVIDHLYSNDFVNSLEPGILAADFSDHLATFLHISKSPSRDNEPSQTLIRDMKNFDEETFILDLHNNLINNIDLAENDTDTLFNSLNNIFALTVNSHAPLRQKTQSEFKKSKSPWITNGIINSIKHKSYLRLRSIKYKTAESISAYNQYRNLTNRIIVKAKRKYYSEKLKAAMNTSRTTWAIINEVIGKKKTKHKKIPKIISQLDGKTLTDPTSITNEFNTYFSNNGKLMANKIPHKPHRILGNPATSSIRLYDSTANEVMKCIENLSTRKASRMNDIPTSFIKKAKLELSFYLSLIFNNCIKSGNYPKQLKIAQVIPIYKKGSKLECVNYRPISILSSWNKIFEKMIFVRLYMFLTKFNILTPHQYGFIQGRSTDLAIYDLIEKHLNAKILRNTSCTIYLDISKAFDTVPRNILLNKLYHYGIRGLAYDLLKSYLSNCFQYTLINGFMSQLLPIEFGVPQGSILGPLLFLIYINDLPLVSNNAIIKLFADDTSIFVNAKSTSDLKAIASDVLCKVDEWMKMNKLTLNYSKTEFMLCNTSRNQQTFSLHIGNHSISQVKIVKYLGVHIDEMLTWKTHISNLENKLSRACALICKLRYVVDQSCLIQYYYAHIYSHLKYAILAWGGVSESSLSKLNVLHRRAVRLMTLHGPLRQFMFYDIEQPENFIKNDELFKSCSILKLNDVYKLELSKLMFKASNCMLPTTYDDILTPLSSREAPVTRAASRNEFYQPISSTAESERRLSYAGPRLWNNIDPAIKKYSFYTFTKKYKSQILASY